MSALYHVDCALKPRRAREQKKVRSRMSRKARLTAHAKGRPGFKTKAKAMAYAKKNIARNEHVSACRVLKRGKPYRGPGGIKAFGQSRVVKTFRSKLKDR